jgi:anti-anti-sigma factor
MESRETAPQAECPREESSLTIESKQGCLWITLPDSITMDSYPQLEERIDDAINGSESGTTVIDLGLTKNMYSAGFGMIVRIRKRMGEKGGSLYLVNAASRVVEAMTYLGLHKVISVYEEGAPLDFLTDSGH